jgi:hypothetical protein
MKIILLWDRIDGHTRLWSRLSANNSGLDWPFTDKAIIEFNNKNGCEVMATATTCYEKIVDYTIDTNGRRLYNPSMFIEQMYLQFVSDEDALMFKLKYV